MNMTFAPAQLPLAPRPLPDELLSSWLMRTAAANAVSFEELLDVLEMRDPKSLVPGQMLDYSIPEITLRALSLLTRVPYSTLSKLDLSVRVPQIHLALLLRFPQRGLSPSVPVNVPGDCDTPFARNARFAKNSSYPMELVLRCLASVRCSSISSHR